MKIEMKTFLKQRLVARKNCCPRKYGRKSYKDREKITKIRKKNLDNFCTYFVPLQRNISWKSQMKL